MTPVHLLRGVRSSKRLQELSVPTLIDGLKNQREHRHAEKQQERERKLRQRVTKAQIMNKIPLLCDEEIKMDPLGRVMDPLEPVTNLLGPDGHPLSI